MPNKRVAVIGAGAAGLAATSYLLEEGLEVTLLEERGELGGVWTNTDTATHPNPIYDGLETNVPRTLMTFTDHKWPENTPMFPPDTMVKAYLQSYARNLWTSTNAHNLTYSLNTTVTRLRHGTENYQRKWKIEASTALYGVWHDSFDAVVVAAGNYTDPYTPDPEPGRRLWEGKHPGTILHSQQYQNSEKFRGKTVLIVGNSASGWDISGHIAKVAYQVLVSVRQPASPRVTVNDGCKAVGMIAQYHSATRKICFSWGLDMCNVDYVIYCTGYLYNFDFAMKGTEPLFQPGFKVANLYQHIFYTREPSLAFVGLPKMTAAFTVAEAQSAVVARAFSGRLDMPDKSTMQAWEQQFSSTRMEQMRSEKAFHTLAQNINEDREYVNMLQQHASSEHLRAGPGKSPPFWCRCLDNARASAGTIRTAYKKFNQYPDEYRHRFTTYHQLGPRLLIPCPPVKQVQYRDMDAVTCFLDLASR